MAPRKIAIGAFSVHDGSLIRSFPSIAEASRVDEVPYTALRQAVWDGAAVEGIVYRPATTDKLENLLLAAHVSDDDVTSTSDDRVTVDRAWMEHVTGELAMLRQTNACFLGMIRDLQAAEEFVMVHLVRMAASQLAEMLRRQ